MKICKKHNEPHVKKGSRTACRTCNKEYQRAWVSKNRSTHNEKSRSSQAKLRKKRLNQYLSLFDGRSCESCGESRIPCLDFDHIDPKTKSFNVSQGFRLNKSWEEILIESQKCTILCANCHRVKTASQTDWYSSGASSSVG